ncbi:MAG: DUF4382 domain-containing protein [Bacteroidota bacterium]
MKHLPILLTVILTFFIGFTACDSTNDDGGTGTMEVTMTDAPANYDSVNVTIKSVRVHQNADSETDSTESDEEAEESGWVTITDEQMKVNLLELTNGNQITLGSEELEAGTYSQVRFILGDDNTVTVDGETYELQTPSAEQSGLKLNVNAEVEENSTYTLLVDFDAARSVVQQGNGGYLLKPVLRAVDLAETGAIAGNVQPSDFKTNVMAISEDDTVTTTITTDEGDFKLIGLIEGTYDVAFDPDSDQHSDTTITDIEVAVNQETTLEDLQLEETEN